MRARVRIGCCGFAGSMADYFRKFKVVEVQQTFYRLPEERTLLRWRSTAPRDFEFTVKAYQAITHPRTSPTWRRAGVTLPEKLSDQIGLLRPTNENFEAWKRTRVAMGKLKSKICVVQCPPSFIATDENINSMTIFFSKIERKGIDIAWEPRHESWFRNPKKVRELADSLSLVHVVDIFKREPLSNHPIAYVRLHGLGKETNYSYKFTEQDLENLRSRILGLAGRKKEVYVFFNNITMREDGLAFKRLLETIYAWGDCGLS
jgi:uncharacterized protein YecE (DUF72 family)